MIRFFLIKFFLISSLLAGGKITGTVYGSGKLKLDQVTVELRKAGSNKLVKSVYTSQGNFIFNRVPNGKYKLVALHKLYMKKTIFVEIKGGLIFNRDEEYRDIFLTSYYDFEQNQIKNKRKKFLESVLEYPLLNIFTIIISLTMIGLLLKRKTNKISKASKSKDEYLEYSSKEKETINKSKQTIFNRISESTKVNIKIIIERLNVFIAPIGEWIATNWTKVKKYVNGMLIEESTVYTSHCWSCKTPIKSIERKHRFATWIGNKWLGNKKCEKDDCTYFICTKCKKCLCDSSFFKDKKSRFNVQKKWKIEKEKNISGKLKTLSPAGVDFDHLSIGDNLEHKIYGIGKVMMLSGKDEDRVITMLFEDGSEKIISAHYPGLKKV